MPFIHYIEHDGTEHVVNVALGDTVMEGARDHGVPGIDADCGGMCACATCHVFVGSVWLTELTPPSEQELELLDLTPDRNEESRLSCQIQMTSELDGIVVRLPASQH